MTAALRATGLDKTYGQGPRAVAALSGLELEIPQGGVYGVLGPNGAGKSTLFRIALGLVRPTSGSVSVLGAAPGDATGRRRLGAMIEIPRFPPYLTARDTLRWLGRASGAAEGGQDAWLDRVGLTEAADRKVNGFSVGMKQRLGLAAALLHGPEVVILDEPTSGMDPVGIQEIRRLLRELADQDGVTVILASHILDEVQRVCDRVAVLNRGKLAAEGPVATLLEDKAALRLTVSPVERALEILGARGVRDGDGVLARVAREEAPELIRALVEAGVAITEARWVGRDLEALFFETTGAAHAA